MVRLYNNECVFVIILINSSSADSTWEIMDSEQDENLNPNTTVRISLRSGEIRYKDGISKKMVVTETRGTPKRVNTNSQRKTIKNSAAAPTANVYVRNAASDSVRSVVAPINIGNGGSHAVAGPSGLGGTRSNIQNADGE